MTPTDGVTIQLTDGEHTLRFDNAALRHIERELGSWDTLRTQKLNALFILIWAGLRHEGAGLSIDDVANLIDLNQAPKLEEQVGEAFVAAYPQVVQRAEDKKAGKAPRTRAKSKATG